MAWRPKKQENKWQVGETVKVGFMTLKVLERIPTPNDGCPDKWLLVNEKNGKKYTFQPYFGLEAV